MNLYTIEFRLYDRLVHTVYIKEYAYKPAYNQAWIKYKQFAKRHIHLKDQIPSTQLTLTNVKQLA